MKRNGIFQSQTRWQNGHYQSTSGGLPPQPIDYGYFFEWNLSNTVGISNAWEVTSSNGVYTEFNGSFLKYRKTTAAREVGLNANTIPNIYILDPVNNPSSTFHVKCNMHFDNLGIIPDVIKHHNLNVGLYVVPFMISNSTEWQIPQSYSVLLNAGDISDFNFIYDELIDYHDTTHWIGTTSMSEPDQFRFVQNLNGLDLFNIISFLGVYRLPVSEQLRIFNTTFNRNHQSLSGGTTSLHNLYSATYATRAGSVRPSGTSFLSTYPWQTYSLMRFNAQYYYDIYTVLRTNITSQGSYSPTANITVNLDSLYKVFISRNIRLNNYQPREYYLLQFILVDENFKVLGDLVK